MPDTRRPLGEQPHRTPHRSLKPCCPIRRRSFPQFERWAGRPVLSPIDRRPKHSQWPGCFRRVRRFAASSAPSCTPGRLKPAGRSATSLDVPPCDHVDWLSLILGMAIGRSGQKATPMTTSVRAATGTGNRGVERPSDNAKAGPAGVPTSRTSLRVIPSRPVLIRRHLPEVWADGLKAPKLTERNQPQV